MYVNLQGLYTETHICVHTWSVCNHRYRTLIVYMCLTHVCAHTRSILQAQISRPLIVYVFIIDSYVYCACMSIGKSACKRLRPLTKLRKAIHTYTYTYIYTYIHTYIRIHMHVCRLASTETHICVHMWSIYKHRYRSYVYYACR
jgi:hypothetical protein